ncbi:MAG TPA: hypothetical protein VIG30_14410 [Ktedonobacterales bacterium]|jgi:hypothetical protein
MAEHSFQVSDEEFRVIALVARERGQAPDDLFHAWVASVRQIAASEAIDPDQAWFWTPEWQEAEARVDAEYAAGLGEVFANEDDFFDDLDR